MRKPLNYLIAAAVLVSALTIPYGQRANAVTAADWKAGRIIDDVIFTASNSMSVNEIQAFLNARVPVCDTWGTKTSELGGGTRAQYGSSQGNPAPFTCLKDYYEVPKTSPGPGEPASNYGGVAIPAGAQSAAQIISNAAIKYNISPKVLLVKLATESPGPLTSDDWPFKRQYLYAMGARCPDSGPGGAANCDTNYSGFSLQMNEGAALLRWYLDSMDQSWWQYKKPYQSNYILWNVVERNCGGSNVYIESKATAALYTYTPYQPNSAALNNMYSTGDNCSAYGNRNFWRVYSDWFGSTHGTIRGGVDYSAVFDSDTYLNNYPDLKASFTGNSSGAFEHFVTFGMKEGRIAKTNFDVNSYRNRYPDLRLKYQTDLPGYYAHFATYGRHEGRSAVGTATLVPVTSYKGVDYSPVYGFTPYLSLNADMQSGFENNDAGALLHFVNYGMSEGRNALPDFSAESYRNRYADLRRSYGNNLEKYYIHFINYGKNEGRIATGSYYGGTAVLNGVDYSPIYEFDTYINSNSDIKNVFGLDDTSALRHFVNYGMGEGRLASSRFNVQVYKQQNADLQQAFGNNLKSYYLHYMNYGKNEGRIAN